YVLLDCGDGPAHRRDAIEVAPYLVLDRRGERFDEVRTGQRVDRARDVRLVGDELLGAQRDFHRMLGRNRERLVEAVGVQRLRSTEHGGQSLEGRTDDVVQRLGPGEGGGRGLGV